MAERRRKAAREPRTPKEPEKPFSAVEQALGLADKPGLSGSRSGAFTYGLLSQAWRALCHNAQGDPETVEVARLGVGQFLRDLAPRDPLEGMLAAQLVGLHDAAMECFRRGAMREQSPEYRDTNLTQANKLVRSYVVLLEALDRHRGKGQPQVVRVERVTVNAGGQAIVGAVAQGGGGSGAGSDEQPHAPAALAHEPGVPLRGADPEGGPVPVAGGAGEGAV